jgi:hypothetical protein
MRFGQLREAFGQTLDEGLIRLGQGQRQQRPSGAGAHRGQIGKVHRQRLPADVGRGGAARKMHAFDQGVDGHGELLPYGYGKHGSVVADAELHVVARLFGALTYLFDQIEFRRFECHRERVRMRGALLGKSTQ